MHAQLMMAAALAAGFAVSTFAQAAADGSDLDIFMRQVLARRDDNWRKLQQYTLEEQQRLQVTALDGRTAYGFRREYSWYPADPPTAPNADSLFVRSPIRIDGVTVSDADRRKAEADWLRREQQRQKRRAERIATGEKDPDAVTLEDVVNSRAEPQFISSAYFMKFKFDAGSYALVGREKLHGTEVLKVEYYPLHFFDDRGTGGRGTGGRGTGGRSAERGKTADTGKPEETGARTRDDVDEKIDRKMDKVSLITLWIEPNEHQILQYEFTNVDWGFLPGQWLFRLDEVHASMQMGQPFPGVWLPDEIAMRFAAGTAAGDIAARYTVKYRDYKLAEVKARIR